MPLLSRWPDRTPYFDGKTIAPTWQRWFSALVVAVNDVFLGTQSGTGSPEGVLTAPVGTLYRRTDGGAGTTLYVKEANTDATGWVAK